MNIILLTLGFVRNQKMKQKNSHKFGLVWKCLPLKKGGGPILSEYSINRVEAVFGGHTDLDSMYISEIRYSLFLTL